MDFSVRTSLPDNLASLRQARNTYGFTQSSGQQQNNTADEKANLLPVIDKTTSAPSFGTRILSEKQEGIDNGYRRIRTYANEDGREFTKIEEFALTQRGARRTVLQQTPSGSITRYEEVLDRQDSGNFRRTQRFQDASGDIATQITTDYAVKDPFVLTQGNAPASYEAPSPFLPLRGTQLDMRA